MAIFTWYHSYEDNSFNNYRPIPHRLAEARVELRWSVNHATSMMIRRQQVLAQRIILLIDRLEKAEQDWHDSLTGDRAKSVNQRVTDIAKLRKNIDSVVPAPAYLREKLKEQRTALQQDLEKSFFGIVLPAQYPLLLEEVRAVREKIRLQATQVFGFDGAYYTLTDISDLASKSVKTSV